MVIVDNGYSSACLTSVYTQQIDEMMTGGTSTTELDQ